MGRIALIAALLMVPNWVYAQTTDPLAVQTQKGLETLRTRIANTLPMREALRVNAVDIVFVPDFADFSMPMALQSQTGRSVRIPLGFASRLHTCIQASVIENRFGNNPRTRDLMSAYDTHFWNSIKWENHQTLDIEVFANLSANERQLMSRPDFQGTVMGLFEQSLAFLFAHELGHHALDLFYTPTTPVSTTQAIETSADGWAADALAAAGIVPFPGALGSLMCIKTRGWSTYVPSVYSSHPSQAARMQQVVSTHKAKWHPLYTKPPYNSQSLDVYLAMEQKLEGFLQKLVVEEGADTVSSLNARIVGAQDKTERIDALLKLARHYQYGWDVPKDSLKQHELLQSAADAGDPWAQYAIAFHFDTGTGVGIDRVKAYVGYTWLALAGDKAAKVNLATLPRRSSAQEICEGKCRVGSTAASFSSCLEQRHTACITACTTKFGMGQAICEQRMCANAVNYVHWYPVCVPTPEKSADQCRQQCQSSATPATTSP